MTYDQHIIRDPKVSGGKAKISGTRAMAIVALAAGILVFLGYLHVKAHNEVHATQATLVVGYASLVYVAQTGKPPGGIQDLFDAGVLHAPGNAKSIRMPGFDLGALPDCADRVRLSFPRSPGEFAVERGYVRSKATGERLVCVSYGDHPVGQTDWAYLWLRVANGEPTGLHWLDRVIRERRPAESQPISGPGDG